MQKWSLRFLFIILLAGSVACTGPQGLAGEPGSSGSPGLQGPIGSAGPTALAGPAGPRGGVGPAGPPGPQGIPGADGVVSSQVQTAISPENQQILDIVNFKRETFTLPPVVEPIAKVMEEAGINIVYGPNSVPPPPGISEEAKAVWANLPQVPIPADDPEKLAAVREFGVLAVTGWESLPIVESVHQIFAAVHFEILVAIIADQSRSVGRRPTPAMLIAFLQIGIAPGIGPVSDGKSLNALIGLSILIDVSQFPVRNRGERQAIAKG